MIRISRQADLSRLRTAATAPSVAAAVETHFAELCDTFDVSPSEREFVLDSGVIVVLENTDDETTILRYLSKGFPEWGEIDHSTEPPVLKFVLMFDNDDLDTVFTQLGVHPAVDEWIEPYLES